MSAIDDLKAAFRKYVTDGVPSTGANKPSKDEINPAFERLRSEMNGISAGLSIVADEAARDAFFAVPANQNKLVYVNDNNGDPGDPDNGVYEYVDGAARIAEGFYQGVASVVQPLVDEAEASAATASTAASDTLGAISPLRLANQHPQPSYADGIVPGLRQGTGGLVAITATSLVALGAVNGVWNASGTTANATYDKKPMPAGAVGQHIYMSVYTVSPALLGAGTSGPLYLDSANQLVTTGLTFGYELVETGVGYYVERHWSSGVVPATATHMGLGRPLGVRESARVVTGVFYRIDEKPLNSLNCAYDDFTPPDAATGDRQAEKWTNRIPFGDFVGGAPTLRSGSGVVTTAVLDFLRRGIERVIQWRAGSEYARYDAGASLLNKWYFGAFVVNSVDAANLMNSAAVLKEDGVGGVTNPLAANVVGGYLPLSATSRIVWTSGLVDTDVQRLWLGSPTTPAVAGTRFAGEFTLFVQDTPIDRDEALRQVEAAAKARGQARRWAKAVASLEPVDVRSTLVLTGVDGVGYVESDRSGHTIRNTFNPFPTVRINTAPCRFNLVSQYIDGTAVRLDATDDIAPDHVEGTTLGGNHGYAIGKCTATGHGKTTDDEGSVWATGGNEYVLVDVVDANTLLIARRTSNVAPPTGTYTHVSGATNTGSISVSAVSASSTENQWYPPHNNYSLRVYVDGGEITDLTGEWAYATEVVFVETCGILPRQTIIDWWIANGGASGGLVIPGDPLYYMSKVYRFDQDGQLTLPSEWAHRSSTAVSDFMGLQVQRLNAPNTYRIPGAEPPISYDGDMLDYGIGVASDRTLTPATSINFNATNLQATGEYAHRVISEWDDYVMVAGLLPVGDAAYNVRRANTTDRAFELRGNSAKLYFRVIDKGDFTAAAGVGFSMIGFRHILPKVAGRPLVCPVRYSDRKAIVYIDWVNFAGFDQVDIGAPDLIGRTITVLDSRNADLIGTGLASGSITADVTATGNHAYLVLEMAA